MQAIHNSAILLHCVLELFQRAKIQDKCKQFTTFMSQWPRLCGCFKEQRYKINASNSQRKRAEAVIQRNLQQAAQDIIRLKQ